MTVLFILRTSCGISLAKALPIFIFEVTLFFAFVLVSGFDDVALVVYYDDALNVLMGLHPVEGLLHL